MRFKDKVALITAVGSGIGRATADIMAKEGAVIVGVDNDERRLAMAMEDIRDFDCRSVSMAPRFSSKVAPQNSPVWRVGDQPWV